MSLLCKILGHKPELKHHQDCGDENNKGHLSGPRLFPPTCYSWDPFKRRDIWGWNGDVPIYKIRPEPVALVPTTGPCVRCLKHVVDK